MPCQFSFLLTAQLFAIADSAIRSVSCLKTVRTVGKVIGCIRGVVAIKTVGKVIGSIREVVAIKRVASCAARRRTVGTFFNFIWFAIKFAPILKFFFVHVFTCYYLGLKDRKSGSAG